jgi:hypothetical protein
MLEIWGFPSVNDRLQTKALVVEFPLFEVKDATKNWGCRD